MKGIFRFGVRGKLSPRFIGPFLILERDGEVAYRIALPPQLAQAHDVFHVSQLRRYVHDPAHVIPFEPLVFEPDLSFMEQPIEILDRREKRLCTKTT
ncbi:hypothetical protein QJS04_geneDACA016841 [Acorus gramineus]|uniref:Tf2-1-like SH3-like domain-containing protein n=1 Tax=Acorus gramineus TaxID=55184 RepID=A0AAV9AP50_ACOGR|nr:hypothetical protein QJS04_geneDACA016841 [Acorus gramineus]